jgi:hypothetical protein
MEEPRGDEDRSGSGSGSWALLEVGDGVSRFISIFEAVVVEGVSGESQGEKLG